MVMRIGIMDGFDHYPDATSFRTVWIPLGGGPPNETFTLGLSGVGRCHEFNGQLNAGFGQVQRAFKGGPSAKMTLLFSFLWTTMRDAGARFLDVLDEFGNRQFGFTVTPLGKLGLVGENEFVVLAQSEQAIAINTVYRVCVQVDSTGGLNVMQVSINGVVDVPLSVDGRDIIDSPSSTLFGAIALIGGYYQSIHKIDDVFVGLDECIELGPKEILTSAPNALVSAEFTPSTGTNLANVDEAQSNLDVDYNSSNTVGQKDLYSYANFARVPESIVAVGMVSHARKEQSATRKLRNILRMGGIDNLGAELPLSETYLWFDDYWLKNPNGNIDWTTAAHDAAEGGYVFSANA